jgi:tetratricopeptide (TPR) repeat protein
VSVVRAAEELYLQGDEKVTQGLALFDLEWDNIRAGQAWAAAHAEGDETAARLCNAYPDVSVYCLDLRLHSRERIAWLKAGSDAARHLGNKRAQGGHLGNLGNAYSDLGQVEQAIDYYEQALAVSREIHDQRMEGNAIGNLGLAYSNLGQGSGQLTTMRERWPLPARSATDAMKECG